MDEQQARVRQVAVEHLGDAAGLSFAALGSPVVQLVAPGAGEAGRSRLGGLPVLGAGEWPQWAGRPLSCLAVIDLGELAAAGSGLDLPAAGALSFFYAADRPEVWGLDPEDRGAWRVVVAPASTAVSGSAPEGAVVFPEVPVVMRAAWCVPGWEERAVGELRRGDRAGLRAVYDELGALGWPAPDHRIGGWPVLVQGPLQRKCQLAANGYPTGTRSTANPELAPLLEDAGSWRMLAQFASDEALGWQWADDGVVYFMIHERDLAARRFENVWMILQSY